MYHSHEVKNIISQLLELGTLRALQVAAVHSSPMLDISTLAHFGVRHLALACQRIWLTRACGDDGAPLMPSMHLLTWVRALPLRSMPRPKQKNCSVSVRPSALLYQQPSW